MALFDGVLETFIVQLTYLVVFGAFVFTLDDIFIDAVAFFRKLKPRKIKIAELKVMQNRSQKHFAIMIANWKEADVIAPMIRGNIRGLEYDNYTFFIGIYPNDTATWNEARKIQVQHPDKVVVVVNTLPGPTSKGQMLNEIASKIMASEKVTGKHYDLFLLQDSEDVLHPHSLTLMNDSSERADFVQIPVFSFDVPRTSLVGGIYIDEFSESHTKDLLVRQCLGAAIPSAGVGTAISREFMKAVMLKQNGRFLNPDTLTEDYHLGIMTKPLGFKSHFACVELEKTCGQKEFIATREYFPHRIMASVRQKSRWTLGITYQGTDNIKWQGDWVDKYFLLRDRRAPFNSVLIVLSLLVLISLSLFTIVNGTAPSALNHPVLVALMFANAFNMALRLMQRVRAVHRVNGGSQACMVPLRWLVANFVNVLASYRAHKTYHESVKLGVRPAWVKTDHQLPSHFGLETEAQVQ